MEASELPLQPLCSEIHKLSLSIENEAIQHMNSVELAQLSGLKYQSMYRRHHKRGGSKRNKSRSRLKHLRNNTLISNTLNKTNSRPTSNTTESMHQSAQKSLEFRDLLVVAVVENESARRGLQEA